MKKVFLVIAAVAFAGFACLPASAALTQINTPDAAYVSSTTLLPITVADYVSVGSLTDGYLTATFANNQEARSVSGSWATWGSPPDTESATPKILWTNGGTSLTINFDKFISTFGLEAESNIRTFHTFTMDFYSGITSLGSISRDINGDAGARLLAASSTTMFDKVIVYTNDDFSTAELRYGAVPEPGTILAALSILGPAGFLFRRRA